MKKSVIFILPNLNGGGAERVTINYINQLEKGKYKLTLIVFDMTDDLILSLPRDLNVIDLKTNSTKKSFLSLISILKKLKPNVVFTTHSRVSSLLRLIKLFVPKFKHIARMQNMPSLEKKYNAYGVFKRTLYALGFKSADIVIAQSIEMKNDAINIFALKENNVVVMNNPLNKKNIQKSIENSLTPFSREHISAVVSGRLNHQKGLDVLFNSLTSVIKEHNTFKLYILGSDRGALKELIALMKKLDLEKHIEFIGFKKNPYIYYAHCDLFILSSRWEGFPNALLENYFLNSPIVSTECVPIVNQLISNNVNGFTCEVENIESMSESIINCIENIKRTNIDNQEYLGSRLEDFL